MYNRALLGCVCILLHRSLFTVCLQNIESGCGVIFFQLRGNILGFPAGFCSTLHNCEFRTDPSLAWFLDLGPSSQDHH